MRVYGVEHLKRFIQKLPVKLFYLATRNTQLATSPTTILKIRWWIWDSSNRLDDIHRRDRREKKINLDKPPCSPRLNQYSLTIPFLDEKQDYFLGLWTIL
jgi:hypothetical protein